MESYNKIFCPQCNKINYLCLSAVDGDLTSMDVDAVECWDCSFVWPVLSSQDLEDCFYIERGLKCLDC